MIEGNIQHRRPGLVFNNAEMMMAQAANESKINSDIQVSVKHTFETNSPAPVEYHSHYYTLGKQ